MKDPDIAFCWCVFFSFVIGCSLACALTVCLLPVSIGNFAAGFCYLALSGIFISLLGYVSNAIFPYPQV